MLREPSEELFYYSLLDDATVHKTGQRATVADREAVEVRVGTVSWGYPPTIFHGFFVPEGTTDHLLLVDEEIGVILRAAARLEGREIYVAEVTGVPTTRSSQRTLSDWNCPVCSSDG